MSEIDQVHLRAVMLFMLETSEIVIIFNIQNFFRIENPLSIKEVMSQNVWECSFLIFDIFDIHSITPLGVFDLSSTYIALQPLGMFDLSLTSLT